jgi:hypothetical protein
MDMQIRDYNSAADLFENRLGKQWDDISAAIRRTPLHLKASDQDGKQGDPIFDPVGTNLALKGHLKGVGWESDVPVPKDHRILGKAVDFAKGSVLIEAQFSNYPFLLNNILRTELFYQAEVSIIKASTVRAAVIITKARMFPASNSTLYFEQAEAQLGALAQHSVFDAPIRLVGMFVKPGVRCTAVWTKYKSRTSRTIVRQSQRKCIFRAGPTERSRCAVQWSD